MHDSVLNDSALYGLALGGRALNGWVLNDWALHDLALSDSVLNDEVLNDWAPHDLVLSDSALHDSALNAQTHAAATQVNASRDLSTAPPAPGGKKEPPRAVWPTWWLFLTKHQAQRVASKCIERDPGRF